MGIDIIIWQIGWSCRWELKFYHKIIIKIFCLQQNKEVLEILCTIQNFSFPPTNWFIFLFLGLGIRCPPDSREEFIFRKGFRGSRNSTRPLATTYSAGLKREKNLFPAFAKFLNVTSVFAASVLTTARGWCS